MRLGEKEKCVEDRGGRGGGGGMGGKERGREGALPAHDPSLWHYDVG